MRNLSLSSLTFIFAFLISTSGFAQVAALTQDQIDAAYSGGTVTNSSTLAELTRTSQLREAALQRSLSPTATSEERNRAESDYNMLTKVSLEQKAALEKDLTRQAAEIAKNTTSPCAVPEKKAVSVCTLGLDPVAEAALKATLNQATAMMQQGGTEKTCKAAKMVQTVAMGANFGHAVMCGGAIKSCKSFCEVKINEKRAMAATDPKAAEELRLATASYEKCQEMETRQIASIVSGIQNLAGMAMSAKCQKAVTAAPPPGSGGTPPSNSDCSSPGMSSMPHCVCASDPSNPMCSASTPGLGDGAGYASDGGGPGGQGLKDPELIETDDEISALEAKGATAAADGGSSGGSGGMGGGSAGALPPEESGGAGSGPYNTDIMGGLTGGGGGGGSFGRGGGGEGSGGGLLDSLADKFNLKGFLPSKGDFKNRGLASGSGVDGITGPNGPSLFEKVSTRYMKKQSELLP